MIWWCQVSIGAANPSPRRPCYCRRLRRALRHHPTEIFIWVRQTPDLRAPNYQRSQQEFYRKRGPLFRDVSHWSASQHWHPCLVPRRRLQVWKNLPARTLSTWQFLLWNLLTSAPQMNNLRSQTCLSFRWRGTGISSLCSSLVAWSDCCQTWTCCGR